MRRKIFGEHAFLPLTLTGNGALSQDAIEMLHGGYLFGLADDTQDRTIMYFDRSRNQNSPQFRNALVSALSVFSIICAVSRVSPWNYISSRLLHIQSAVAIPLYVIVTSGDVHDHGLFGGACVCPSKGLCCPCQWLGKILFFRQSVSKVRHSNGFELLLYPHSLPRLQGLTAS
jgi:hypothetical protein